MKEIASVLYIN